jgi:hypothetical protein
LFKHTLNFKPIPSPPISISIYTNAINLQTFVSKETKFYYKNSLTQTNKRNTNTHTHTHPKKKHTHKFEELSMKVPFGSHKDPIFLCHMFVSVGPKLPSVEELKEVIEEEEEVGA